MTSWSFASDKKLFDYLKQFSDDLLAKTHSLNTKLTDLDFEVVDAGVTLKSALSSFYILADTQFIENVSCFLLTLIYLLWCLIYIFILFYCIF